MKTLNNIGCFLIGWNKEILKESTTEPRYIDEKRIIKESCISIFRAGADMLITYYAPEIAEYIQGGEL